MNKLDVKALAIAVGVSWAACMLFVGWVGIFAWGTGFIKLMSTFYIGFAPTFIGGIIGAIWGFIDGAIGGLIIASVYNLVVEKK